MSVLTHIYISPESNYWKHKKNNPGTAPTHSLSEAPCHAGQGIVGDRFYDFKKNYSGQVSLMSEDALLELREFTGVEADFSVFRRNLIVSGLDPLTLKGKRFFIGDVEMEGHADCTPCAWMDYAAGTGSFKWLSTENKGGLRAKIISSGTLKVGESIRIS